jgi:hypothetical protein
MNEAIEQRILRPCTFIMGGLARFSRARPSGGRSGRVKAINEVAGVMHTIQEQRGAPLLRSKY